MRSTKKKIVDNEIVNRILATMQQRGIRQKDLMTAIGVANPVFTSWKYDNGKSYMNYIDKIAAYLSVSSNYLLTGKTDETAHYSLEDIELIQAFHNLAPKKQLLVKEIIFEFASI